ncbi:MAG: caspase family protein [Pirellulales bacterium]
MNNLRHRSLLVKFFLTVMIAAVGFLLPSSGKIVTAADYFDPQLIIDAHGLVGNAIVSVDTTQDGRWLAAASGKEVHIWDRLTGEHYATLRGYQEPGGYRVGSINTVRFLSDNRHLAVAISDNTEFGSTRLYDITNPQTLKQLIKGHVGCTMDVAVSPQGKYLVSWGCDQMLYVNRYSERTESWNLISSYSMSSKGAGPKVLPFPYEDSPDFRYDLFAFPWNDSWFLSGDDSSGALLSMETGAFSELSTWPQEIRDLVHMPSKIKLPEGKNLSVSAVDLRHHHGTWCALSGYASDENADPVYWSGAWHVDSDTPTHLYTKHRERPTAVTLNPSAGLAASGDAFGEVHVWKLAGPHDHVEKYETENLRLYAAEWSEDGDAVRFADSFFPPERFDFNFQGPISREFRLADRSLHPAASSRESRKDSDVLLVDDSRSTIPVQCRAKQVDAWELMAKIDGEWSSIDPFLIDNFPKYDVPAPQLIDSHHFGTVWTYAAVPKQHKLTADPELFIGTDTGVLVQASLSRISNSLPPCLLIQRYFIGHSARVTSVDVSPDGNRLLSSSWDGTLRIWRLDERHRLPDVDFHSEGTSVVHVPKGSEAERAGIKARDVIISMNGSSFFARHRRAMAGEFTVGDTVRIERGAAQGFGLIRDLPYQKKAGKGDVTLKLVEGVVYSQPALSIFLTRDGDWVAWTPEGYYDASAEGEKFIGWHINRQRHEPALFHGVSQFREQLYRPDLVNHAIGVEQAVEAVANRPLPPAPDLSAPKQFNLYVPPEVSILAPSDGKTTKSNEVAVQASVAYRKGTGRGIKDITVRVNGVTPENSPELVHSLTEGDTTIETFEVHVALIPGENIISVVATNFQQITSHVKQVRVECGQDEMRPNLYILAIGISDYSDSTLDLSYAAKDAADFVDVFRQQQKFYSNIEARLITNEQATVEAIKDGMAWLQKSVSRATDYAFVFIAGHGVFDSTDTWYFGSVDLDPKSLFTTGVSQAEFRQFMEEQLRGQTIFFADTCHSGGAFGDPSSDVRVAHSRGFDPWRSFQKLAIFSCQPNQGSLEGAKWKNGAFTYCLKEALSCPKCDADGDGFLNFDELALFVKRDVSQLTDRAQQPTTIQNIPTGIVNIGHAASSKASD